MSVSILIGDCRSVLAGMPEASVDAVVTDLQAGKAGEYLVCADLILKGHIAYPSEQGLPYDVVADVGGRLLKVQVKTTRGQRSVQMEGRDNRIGYIFHIDRKGKGGTGRYGKSDVDLFALVSLDNRQIGYLHPSQIRKTLIFRDPALKGQYLTDQHARQRAEFARLKAEGVRVFDISAQYGIDRSAVYRAIKVHGNEMRPGRYLEDYTFSNAIKAVLGND